MERGVQVNVQTGESKLSYYQPPEINLEALKEEKIQKLKSIGKTVVYSKAPDYKQANAALGILTEEEKQAIINWIQAVRQTVDEVEAQIGVVTTLEGINSIAVDFDSLKARAEEISHG